MLFLLVQLAQCSNGQLQMQKQVERGQSPKEVDRIDKLHVEDRQPHVHFKDGTIHDIHRGILRPSKYQ